MDENGVNIKELFLEFFFLKKKKVVFELMNDIFVVVRWYSFRDIVIKI